MEEQVQQQTGSGSSMKNEENEEEQSPSSSAVPIKRKSKKTKQLTKVALKKILLLMKKCMKTLEELEQREIPLEMTAEEDEEEEERIRTEARLRTKVAKYRDALVKHRVKHEFAAPTLGRNAVEDELIILGTENQVLNDAMTAFVNKKTSRKRKYLAAEFGNNYIQHFNNPSYTDVLEILSDLKQKHGEMFSENEAELEKLASCTVKVVNVAIKKRRWDDYQSSLEDWTTFAKERKEEVPSEEALAAVDQKNPLTAAVSLQFAENEMEEAVLKGDMESAVGEEGEEETADNSDKDKEQDSECYSDSDEDDDDQSVTTKGTNHDAERDNRTNGVGQEDVVVLSDTEMDNDDDAHLSEDMDASESEEGSGGEEENEEEDDKAEDRDMRECEEEGEGGKGQESRKATQADVITLD